MILKTFIFLSVCLLSVQLVSFAQTNKKRTSNSNKTNTKQINQPKTDADSKLTTSQNQSNIKPQKTENPSDYIAYIDFPNDDLFKETLLVRTSAVKINLKSQSKVFPQINLYLFYEAVLKKPAFEKKSNSEFIIKEASDYAYLHIINKSEPNLTFDSQNYRLLWFNTDNARISFGTLSQQSIINFDPLRKSNSPVQLETITSLITNQGEITELLSAFESTNKLEKISESKNVIGYLGEFEFEFTDLHKNILREFIAKIKTGASSKQETK